MPSTIRQQTLDYQDNTEEMIFLGQVLHRLQAKDIVGATALLLSRQDYLMGQTQPTLAPFDPRKVP